MNDVVTEKDLIQAVREAAMLCDISISVWQGQRTDARLLNEVKKSHGATGDVGKVVKNLLAGADAELRSTRSAYLALRNKHYEMTLPWVSDPHSSRAVGPRLLPTLLFQQYSTVMFNLKREAEVIRDELVFKLPDLYKTAQTNLAGMVDPSEYPTPEEVKDAFRVHFDFEPLPEGSRFRGLDDHMIERLSQRLHAKQQRQLTEATGAMWTAAEDRLSHLAGRLVVLPGEDAPRFKEASVEAVRDLAKLLPGWNVTGNPLADEIAADIGQILDGITAQMLRDNEQLRADTAKRVQLTLDKIQAAGVGSA